MTLATIALLPIMEALKHAEEDLQLKGIWRGDTREHDLFLGKFLPQKNLFRNCSAHELHGLYSYDHEVLNTILLQKGLAPAFVPFTSLSFGILSIVDISLRWMHKGEHTTLEYKKAYYPGVLFRKGSFTCKRSGNHPHPISCLRAHDGDMVYITAASSVPQTTFSFLELITKIRYSLVSTSEFSRCSFPKVFLCDTPDMRFLEDIEGEDRSGNRVTLSRIIQHIKFSMNEDGEVVKRTASGSYKIDAAKKLPHTLCINRPFFLWIERPGVTLPVFAAYIDENSWRDPRYPIPLQS